MLRAEKGRLEFGDAQPYWGAGNPSPRREGQRGGRRSLPPAGQGRRPGQPRLGRRDPGRPHAPRPAAAGEVPGPGKARSPRPNSISADSTAGCPGPPHLERGGTGGNARRNRPPRSGRRPEVEGRGRKWKAGAGPAGEPEVRLRNGNASEARPFVVPLVSLGGLGSRRAAAGACDGDEGARPF